MFLSEQLTKKWEPVLNHDGLGQISDKYKRAVTAVVLENQERALREERTALFETPANNIAGTGASDIDRYDPILISLVRRALPNLMAYDVAGVQPMTGPTGLIFAMKSAYSTQAGTEALFNEADTDFAGTGTHAGSNPVDGAYTTGTGVATVDAEQLGESGGTDFNQMAFSIEKTTVTAKTRALKAEYTVELAQDLKAIHGLDAEGELSNILSQEILAEINREVIRTIYKVAKTGAASTATAGTFDLDVDSNGRWSVERFKGLLFNIERDANVIAQDTRRGKGNFIICSSDVAAALSMAGVLDTGGAINGAGSLQVDDTGNTFVGTLQGRYKVFVDPYSANTGAASQFYVVGYKGANAYDAGIFYCPYVPLQMVRAIDPNTFQPKIGFKTRYGMIANPFVTQSNGTTDGDTFTANRNQYYRRVKVTNLM
jgi:hypothetical protein